MRLIRLITQIRYKKLSYRKQIARKQRPHSSLTTVNSRVDFHWELCDIGIGRRCRKHKFQF